MFGKLFTGPKDELEAIQIAGSGHALRRSWQGIRAGLALALNPDDVQQVFYLAISVDLETLPLIAERMRAAAGGRELLQLRPAIDSRSVDFAALRALPENTLGGAYARMLQRNRLDPDLFQRPPVLPDDLAYVAQRARQTHDLWHVLTGLDTDIAGEIALQAFTYEQLHQNFSWLIMTFGQTFFGAKFPQLRALSTRARRAGAAAPYLLAVRWEDHWEEPLADIRERFNLSQAVRELAQLAAAGAAPVEGRLVPAH